MSETRYYKQESISGVGEPEFGQTQNINKVTIVRTVQGRQGETTHPVQLGETWSVVEAGHTQRDSRQQNFIPKESRNNELIVTATTIPTRIQSGQVPTSRDYKELGLEYKTDGKVFSKESSGLVNTSEKHVSYVSGILSSAGIQSDVNLRNLNNQYPNFTGPQIEAEYNVQSLSTLPYSLDENQYVDLKGHWAVSEDGTRLRSAEQSDPRAASWTQGSYSEYSTLHHGQDPLTVQTFYVHSQGTGLGNSGKQSGLPDLTDEDIRLISAKGELGLRPVTVQDLRISGHTPEIKPKTESDFSFVNQDTRLVSSNIEHKPVITHTLRLEGSPSDWKLRELASSDSKGPGTVHTLEIGLQGAQSVEQWSTAKSSQAISTSSQNYRAQDKATSTGEAVTLRHLSADRQIFGPSDILERELQTTTVGRTDSNSLEQNYIVKTSSTPVETVQERQGSLVYQVQVTPHSQDRNHGETQIFRSSSLTDTPGSVYSATMGNEHNKMAQADITVEEDEGGNKMIVVEGANIRVHSENYDTGRKGAKRVVLMPESARPENKQFRNDREGSVHSYESFDKHGQKEKMVVLNGHLRDVGDTMPGNKTRVTKISTPLSVRREYNVTSPQPTNEDGKEDGKVTRVMQLNGNAMRENDGRLHSHKKVWVLERSQQAEQRPIRVGEKDGIKVQRVVRENEITPQIVREVSTKPQLGVTGKAVSGTPERRVIRVVNSEQLSRSLKGDAVILEKSPPQRQEGVVQKQVTVRGIPPNQNSRREESRHTAQLQPRSRQASGQRSEDNVFNTHYYINRENPLYAEISPQVNRQSQNLGVSEVQMHTEEPTYATVNKVRKPVATEIKVTSIATNGQANLAKTAGEVENAEPVGYGISALLAREKSLKVEKNVVHVEGEGEITETKLLTSESAQVNAEPQRIEKDYNFPAPPDVVLSPPKERLANGLAHVIVEESIAPEVYRRHEEALDLSHLDLEHEKRVKTKLKKRGDRSDATITGVQLPDQFFYMYEGNKLKKRPSTDFGSGLDTTDGGEIKATVSSELKSERTLKETKHRRVKPKSKSVRQNVHVDHEEVDIKGKPHLHHADGTDANAHDLLTFDTVSEDVSLGVKDGVAQVEVKVRCERVSPIEGSFNMWRMSAVIITRVINIDLEANEERRELQRKILNNELGDTKMIANQAANQNTFVDGVRVMDKKQTFRVYSALMEIADESEREALMERRPSKLLSIDSGEPEDPVIDVHKYAKAKKLKAARKRHSHRHHRRVRDEGSSLSSKTDSIDLLY